MRAYPWIAHTATLTICNSVTKDTMGAFGEVPRIGGELRYPFRNSWSDIDFSQSKDEVLIVLAMQTRGDRQLRL